MKRTLAFAVLAGAVLLSGACSRPQTEAPPAPAPVSTPAAAPAHKASGTSGTSGRTAAPAAAATDDVDDLLHQVDTQLNSTQQPVYRTLHWKT